MRYQSKSDRLKGVEFAEGGSGKMFKEQAAGPAKGGITGKAQNPAPGAKRAAGGPKTTGRTASVPAAAGRTAPRRH
jgi:hypothetical protein